MIRRLLTCGLMGLIVPLYVGCRDVGAAGGGAQLPTANSAAPVLANAALAPPSQLAKRPQFDGDKAFALLKAQCDFGPRPVGSDAHKRTRDYLLTEMQKYADKTSTQDFTYKGMK